MVQKARRGKRYAGCWGIVPKKMNLKFDLLRESQLTRCLSMSEQVASGHQIQVFFDGF